MPDLTTKILIEIRDEIKEVRGEIRATNTRLDATNERLDSTNERLASVERRQTESEARLATELIAVRHSVDRVVELFQEDRVLREDVSNLKVRVEALERKAV